MSKTRLEGLTITNEGRLGDNTQEVLEKFVDEQNFHGTVLVSDVSGKRSVVSRYENDMLDRPFATHSVSKVFTGVLVSEMLVNDMIPRDALDKPIQLDDDVRIALPAAVQERLKESTLRQVMTHESGLGDYLDRGADFSGYGAFGYSKHVKDQLDSGQAVKPLTKPEDYLPFADHEIHELSDSRTDAKGNVHQYYYSDLGILLMGLSAQHHYNEKKPEGEKKNLDDILKEVVLDPAEITNFSAAKPDNAVYNLSDPIAPHIYGSPACGYWTTLEEMEKFGKRLCERWQDEDFREVVKDCGDEFYNPKTNSIQHHGGIPSSQTWFSVNLNNQTVVFSEDHSGKDNIHETFGMKVSNGVNKAVMEEQEQQVESDDKKDEKSSESFVKRFAGGKKSKEFEDLGEARKSWQEIVYADRSKDDSFTR